MNVRPKKLLALLGAALVLSSRPCIDAVRAKPEGQNATMEDAKKAEDLVKEQFPVLRTPGIAALIPVADQALSRTFPEHEFFAVIFRQHPVARLTPEPLKSQNIFAVKKDGQVRHLKDVKALEEFFRKTVRPVTDAQSAKDGAEAWLRLREPFQQDGFFKFSIPKDSLVAAKSASGWRSAGKVVVTEGGKGEIHADLTFTEGGELTGVQEKNSVKAGVRPICQATKLLDPDPVVRRMAEKDILVMGRAAKEYLDEERTKASPERQKAIDRIWQRIVNEGW